MRIILIPSYTTKILAYRDSTNPHSTSSNYSLYADISNRVMQTIATFVPALEVYSIDECFVDAGGISDLEALGREWRQITRQWTGITCGISGCKCCCHCSSFTRVMA